MHLGTYHPSPKMSNFGKFEEQIICWFTKLNLALHRRNTYQALQVSVFVWNVVFRTNSGREVKKGCVSLLISLNNYVQVIKRLNLFDNPNRKHFFNPNSLKRVTPWRKSFNSCAFFRTNANCETERVCQVPTSFLGKVVEYGYQKLSLKFCLAWVLMYRKPYSESDGRSVGSRGLVNVFRDFVFTVQCYWD